VLLDGLCRQGLAVVMLSSEMDELIELMDRVVVFRDLAVSEQLTRSELSRQRLAAAYFGHEGAAA
jgi:ABC-type sugar transport system ATPase subunit